MARFHERYMLFHPKLNEYLQQVAHTPGNEIQFDAEEVETLHGQVADWCERGTLEQLWLDLPNPLPRDDYQEYARKHYITHLHDARRFERLFAVLNNGGYERGKLRFDRSTRSSAVDLMLGCQAAACGATTSEEGKKLLTYLWRYTLLRTNLTTQADAYPTEAFQALLALGREREALDLAELLTQPASKLAVLILITEYLLKQPARATEGMQLYTRAYEIATASEDNGTRTRALRDLTVALIHVGQLTRAEDVARAIVNNDEKAAARNDISDAYGRQNNWHLAEEVALSITIDEERVQALSNLAARLKLAKEEEKAETLWQEASTIASAIADSDQRSRATHHLSVSFILAKDWERAETTTRSIDSNDEKISSLCQLALSFIQEGLAQQAETAWEEAQKVASTTKETDKRDKAYRVYAIAQDQAGHQSEAETIAKRMITSPTEKIAVFSSLASNLVRKGLWERSKPYIYLIVKEYNMTDVAPSVLDNSLIRISIDLARRDHWEPAREVAFTIPRKEARCIALMGIVRELARAGMSGMAQTCWEEARAMCTGHTDTVQVSVAAILVAAFVEVGQIAQAKQIIPTLPDKQTRESILEELAVALARAGQIAEAEKIAHDTTYPIRKENIQRSIAIAQIKAGQSEQAIATTLSIPHVERQSLVLVDLVTICCQMHQWDLAQEIAGQIQSDPLRAGAQRHVVVALVRNGQLKTAQDLVRTIDGVPTFFPPQIPAKKRVFRDARAS
jgi:hypothetical protein